MSDFVDLWLLVELFVFLFFFFNDTATTEIYTLSLHDALPISSIFSASNLNALNEWQKLLAQLFFDNEHVLTLIKIGRAHV